MTEKIPMRFTVGGAFTHAATAAPLPIDWTATAGTIAAAIVADYMGLPLDIDPDGNPYGVTSDYGLSIRFSRLHDCVVEVIDVLVRAGTWRTVRHCLATGQNAEHVLPTIEQAIWTVFIGE